MKIKLDENFDLRHIPVITEHGHDVDTVSQERLCGSNDEVIYEMCQASGRLLWTFDMDFSNPLRFPPANTSGIVVIRPARQTFSLERMAILNALDRMKRESPAGKLWIAEHGCVRVYSPDGK